MAQLFNICTVLTNTTDREGRAGRPLLLSFMPNGGLALGKPGDNLTLPGHLETTLGKDAVALQCLLNLMDAGDVGVEYFEVAQDGSLHKINQPSVYGQDEETGPPLAPTPPADQEDFSFDLPKPIDEDPAAPPPTQPVEEEKPVEEAEPAEEEVTPPPAPPVEEEKPGDDFEVEESKPIEEDEITTPVAPVEEEKPVEEAETEKSKPAPRKTRKKAASRRKSKKDKSADTVENPVETAATPAVEAPADPPAAEEPATPVQPEPAPETPAEEPPASPEPAATSVGDDDDDDVETAAAVVV